ncbi:precorrin-6A reductase [Loktanella fryxellensis]|uniref:Precorrin-6A reductase n=1 Tax=Loktanella fryxellensis TaxID=245187 RepID=A0A1H8C836_9RHOB|nr:cobalt-precorrin-6A reductase [Loktanella fryxellensis]SEM91200.1 precorrin-6A reductase [Loktanella fryxellensis]
MSPNLLILGGTTEASALAALLAARRLQGTVSFAGRVAHPTRQPLPARVGGFGGVAGLVDYLTARRITHVIDATHPFAAQMSHNALAACAQARVPLIALTRPAWQRQDGDDWLHVPDIAGAVAALDRPATRVMLAVGRMHLAAFAPQPQHDYLLRLVDPPDCPLPLPRTTVIVDRGPFAADADRALMERHRIRIVVAKNAGGTGASAKIAAARALHLPVVMIDRPVLPARHEVHDPAAVLDWLAHDAALRGV